MNEPCAALNLLWYLPNIHLAPKRCAISSFLTFSRVRVPGSCRISCQWSSIGAVGLGRDGWQRFFYVGCVEEA